MCVCVVCRLHEFDDQVRWVSEVLPVLCVCVCVVCRLHEFDDQVRWVREGMAHVLPVPMLSLFTGYELEMMV